MKKKIVIVTSEFGKQGGGLSNSALQLANLFCEQEFRVEVIISSSSEVAQDEAETNQLNLKVIHNEITIVTGGYNPNLQRDLFFRGHLNNISLMQKSDLPNLVIAFGVGFNGLFASELSKLLNVKLIAMPRGSELNLATSNSDLFYFNAECLKQATAVVCVSNELLQRARNIFFNPQTIYAVIPNTININESLFTAHKKQNVFEIIIGTGAKYLNEKKGIANLIQTLALLNSKSYQKFNLHLAGFVDKDLFHKYNELINSLNLSSHVKFLGLLNREQFIEEIQNWDIALQGSFCEGFSNSIGDAISIGKPFMITDTGFVAEQIKIQFPDLVFLTSTPRAISEKISETFFQKDILQLAAQAANLIKQSVSENSVSLKWSSFINEVSSNKQSVSFPINNEHILSLLLHEISESSYTGVDLPNLKFEELCLAVNNFGFRFCSAEQYFSAKDKTKLIVCTFDDGYNSVLQFGLSTLKRFGFTATVFVCTNQIGKTNEWNPKDKSNRKHMTLDELLTLKNEGWEIGSHGTNHISFLRLDENEILKSATDSKNILSKHFGKISSFAYPYGDTSPFVEGIVKQHYENIFSSDSGGTHILLDRQKIKRYSISEIQSIFST